MGLAIPLHLTDGAFSVYQQLSTEDKRETARVKMALKFAFGLDSFTAYEKFVKRQIKEGESVDVYLADLKRLSSLFGCTSEKLVSCAFTAGLPDRTKQALRAGARIESMGLSEIVERARMLLIEDSNTDTVLFARGRGYDKENVSLQRKGKPRLCFHCGKPNHFARECPLNSHGESTASRNTVASGESRVCFRCNMPGHIAKDCELNSNEEKRSAPVFSSKT